MTYFILFIIGLLKSLFGSIIGSGGGFILMPILLFLYPETLPDVLTSISLFTAFLCSFSGSFAYAKMKRIDYHSVIIFSLSSIPGSIIGSILTHYIQRDKFNSIFGIIIILTALFIIIRSNLKKRPCISTNKNLFKRSITESDGTFYEYSYNPFIAIIISFFIGLTSSFIGVGGGIFYVPFLVYILNFPIHVAVASAYLSLCFVSFSAVSVHIFMNSLNGQFYKILFLGTGALIGAQIGARISKKVNGKIIIYILSFSMIIVGIKLML